MTQHSRADEFDSLMADWFDRDAQVRPPEQLLAATLERTARTRPHPAWRLPERWIPLATLAIRRPAVPRGASALLLIALLVVAFAAALILYAGSHRLPPMIGPAGNGRIAYVAGGQLYTANSAGTDVRQLTTGPLINSAAFSNDGTRIVYLTDNMTTSTEHFLYVDLHVADADGTHARVLMTNARGVSDPAWSPDGRFIAVSTTPEGAKDQMMMVAADGSGVTDLGDFGAGAWGPSWSSDGQRLAMVVGAEIWIVDRDGRNARQISKGSYKEVGGAPQWSPDGTLLLFSGGDQSATGYYGQYIVGLDGAPERPVEPCACGGLVNDSNGADGVWSPDGSRFAYLKAGTGSGPSVVIADRTGKTIRNLGGSYTWHWPVWSPDGTLIAIANDKQGTFNLAANPYTVILDAVGNAAPVIVPGVVGVDLGGGEIPSFSVTWQRVAP